MIDKKTWNDIQNLRPTFGDELVARILKLADEHVAVVLERLAGEIGQAGFIDAPHVALQRFREWAEEYLNTEERNPASVRPFVFEDLSPDEPRKPRDPWGGLAQPETRTEPPDKAVDVKALLGRTRAEVRAAIGVELHYTSANGDGFLIAGDDDDLLVRANYRHGASDSDVVDLITVDLDTPFATRAEWLAWLGFEDVDEVCVAGQRYAVEHRGHELVFEWRRPKRGPTVPQSRQQTESRSDVGASDSNGE